MTTAQTEIQSQVIDLSLDAFEAFCGDISGMFGIEMDCEHQEASIETASKIQKKFRKIAGVTSVNSTGILDGTFKIVFNKEGLFTLAGTIIMLPEKVIIGNRKHGSIDDAKELSDSFGEAGNLLVGSWDRIFREGLEGHEHFVQGETFLGNPWINTEKTIGLPKDEEFWFIPCQMTIDPYPPFEYGIIFPKTLFEKQSTPDSQAADIQQEEIDTPQESQEINEELIVEDPIQQEEIDALQIPEEIDKESIPEESAQQEEEDIPSADSTPIESTIPDAIKKMVQSPPYLPGNQHLSSLSVCAKDIMKSKAVWADPEDDVQQALKLMEQTQSDYIMVGKDNNLEGVISTRDINSAVSIYLRPMFAKWRRPIDDATLQIKIKWIMSKILHTSVPEAPLAEVMEKMFQFNCKCLPIVDHQGKLYGLITVSDIFEALLNPNSAINTSNSTPLV